MISLWIVIGLFLATIGVASLGAYFSITGLAALFSGAALAVWLMAGSLEFAKFMLAAYLHQTWKSLNLVYKTYLTFAIVVLSVITSIGIYGFLSDAYQSASAVYEAETVKIENTKKQQTIITAEIARLNQMVEEIPEKRISRRLKMRAEIEPQIQALNKQYNASEQILAASNIKIIDIRKKVGPLMTIAKTFNISLDKTVNYLILLLVSVFDPLAICLVMASTNALDSRRRKPETIVTPESQSRQPLFTEVATEHSIKPIVRERASEETTETDNVIVQMNFKDQDSDKKAV